MSQVLGKPQPQGEDDGDEEEEEDELVGLADYGDGPDSSDADLDSGAEEGGERRSPLAPFLPAASSRPRRAGRAGRRPGADPGEPTWGDRGGAKEATWSCESGEPVREAEGGPGSVGKGEAEESGLQKRALFGPGGPVPPSPRRAVSAGAGGCERRGPLARPKTSP